MLLVTQRAAEKQGRATEFTLYAFPLRLLCVTLRYKNIFVLAQN